MNPFVLLIAIFLILVGFVLAFPWSVVAWILGGIALLIAL